VEDRAVALIGTMGAGKTTVGLALAARLGWTYLDNDELLRADGGLGADEILATLGEPELRRRERDALHAAVACGPRTVVGVAGGTGAEPATRALLAGLHVVWLRASPQTLTDRVRGSSGRPWLTADALTSLQALDSARRDAYATLATVVVDVDGLTPDEVVDRVVAALA
jgi:shikimate kinase